MTDPIWLQVKSLGVDRLADKGAVDPNPQVVQAVGVAFQRLQTKAMQDAANAQIAAASDQKSAAEAAVRAAKAAEDTAEYTKNTAWWMMWSVFVLAGTSVATLIVTVVLRH
jgi:hypothetical protein